MKYQVEQLKKKHRAYRIEGLKYRVKFTASHVAVRKWNKCMESHLIHNVDYKYVRNIYNDQWNEGAMITIHIRDFKLIEELFIHFKLTNG